MQKLTPLSVTIFPGAANWPLWAGLRHGFFTAEGLDVSLIVTPNSRQMARALYDGATDVALTAIDNVIAYVSRQGEEKLNGDVDFFAFMGVDNGLLSLVSRPDISRIDDLAGQTLAVDAMTTGFAFVLQELLTQTGLQPDAMRFASVGNGAERLKALLAGSHAATLLNTPLDLIAEAAGCHRLVRACDTLGPYQGIVGAARRSWAHEHAWELISFIRGFHTALNWLRDPTNHQHAISLLRENIPHIDAHIADRIYETLLKDPDGLTPNLKVNPDGVETVLQLRRYYAPSKKNFKTLHDYTDDRFRIAALSG